MSERKEKFLEWVVNHYPQEVVDEARKILENNDNPTDSELQQAQNTARNIVQDRNNGPVWGHPKINT